MPSPDRLTTAEYLAQRRRKDSEWVRRFGKAYMAGLVTHEAYLAAAERAAEIVARHPRPPVPSKGQRLAAALRRIRARLAGC